MYERVMQFRIGMFVIVAGLVLTMLIVWFGESPSLLRDHAFVKVRYKEAPGVAEGMLSLGDLTSEAGTGTVDTVLAAFTDMQGRLVGKRIDERYLELAYQVITLARKRWVRFLLYHKHQVLRIAASNRPLIAPSLR